MAVGIDDKVMILDFFSELLRLFLIHGGYHKCSLKSTFTIPKIYPIVCKPTPYYIYFIVILPKEIRLLFEGGGVYCNH